MKDVQATTLAQTIGRCIGKRRASCNLTQEYVSEKLDIGTEAVSRMERGITIPTIARLAELATIFNCGIDELLIETSTRIDDQAEYISNLLYTLPDADRSMVVDVVEKICTRLKDRL